MRHLALAASGLLALPLFANAPQEPAEPAARADFGQLIEQAKVAWSGAEYGACLAKLKEATSVVNSKRIEAILAAFPPAPSGYELVPRKSSDSAPTDALSQSMAGGLAVAFGSVIEREYRGPERLKVTVTADSPLVPMLAMVVKNPAMLDGDSELVEYEAHQAILKKTNGGDARELMIVLAGSHLCQVHYSGSDKDFLLGVFDQAALDRLARALSR
jgi:hypothetical protein